MSANSLYRLVYASRATVVTVDDASVNANLARILMQSRKNNPPQGLVGALYYADGCFFQVLEGPRAAVDALYAKLHGREVLGRYGVVRFDPYTLSPGALEDLVQLLVTGSAGEPLVNGVTSMVSGSTVDHRATQALWIAGAALVMSAAALIVAVLR
jgi:hypothetical protein